ncbi:putative uncharacterized protein [Staphylococcus equorum subsp. equorum Mu2]|uniref:hypothetical protein n=1 Tax=Staphylococcus equorum TaxID=246432 RepID=UPI000267DD5E|nr:hypothetical protein [Staphylococcus equorum]CCI61341.1 putative uncharacterized protein [Staphylococcus equorum subsp. equorum Mu2]
MVSVESITTKRASELLDISPSSLRVYAQTMELLEYEFKKVDNARQFTQYDLQIIREAMERYKLMGGTMKQALRYSIVKAEQGEEVANALPTREVTTSDNNLQSLQEVESHIVEQVTKGLADYIMSSNENTIQAIKSLRKPSEDIELLKDKNASLETSVSHTQDELEKLRAENEVLKDENIKLRSNLEQLQNMSIWEFRKWKKEK